MGRLAIGLVVAAVVLAVGVVTALGCTDNPWATPVAAFITGALAFASGAVLVVQGTWGPNEAPFRRLLGLALCIWAAGQVVLGVELASGETGFPLPGDLLSVLAAPFALAGAVTVPRQVDAPWPTLRLGLDSVLLGIAGAFLAWRLGFHVTFTGGAERSQQAAAAIILLVDVSMVSLALLGWLRNLGRGLFLAAVGTACYVLGDLLTVWSALQPTSTRPWQGAVLWCLAWPLIAVGLFRFRPPGPRSLAPLDPDTRVVAVTTSITVVVLLVGIETMIIWGDADPSSLHFITLAVVVVGVRELLNGRARGKLVRSLNAEATTDPLTGLPNRRVLAQRVRAVPPGESWCLLRVDLDGFKDTNDIFGHAVGDRLLQAVARNLRTATPVAAVVSRTGGDEFSVLVPGTLDDGRRLGGALVRAVRAVHVDVDGHRARVTCGIGVAAVEPGPADAVEDPLGPLSGAGAALHRAQARGRSQVVVFGAELSRERRRRLDVEDRLRRTLDSGGLDVAFQPVVDLHQGRVIGAEALARWRDPSLGDVGPAEFIPVAEQTGMVIPLGEHVLDATLAAAAAAGFPAQGLRVSVNVSPLQLRVPGFRDVVLSALHRHSMPAELVVIEVTESVLVERSGPAIECLRALAEAGLPIAIDDFGSGYSSLAYVGRLPAGIVKVDRELAPSLTESASSRALLRVVVDLGRALRLGVVLEGVETAEVAELARLMGVRYAQGAFFGSATTAVEVVRFAERGAWVPGRAVRSRLPAQHNLLPATGAEVGGIVDLGVLGTGVVEA